MNAAVRVDINHRRVGLAGLWPEPVIRAPVLCLKWLPRR